MKISNLHVIKAANETLLSEGNLDALEMFFTLDYKIHVTGRDLKGGHKLVRNTLSELRKSFSEIKVEIDILVEDKNRVAWQRTIHAAHSDKFKGFPATGRKIIWRDMVISQFREGLIAEEWVITDLAERLLLSRKGES
jgi:predicted ester cyclase